MQNLRDDPYKNKKEIKTRFFPLSVSFILNALGEGLVVNGKSKITYSCNCYCLKKNPNPSFIVIYNERGFGQMGS